MLLKIKQVGLVVAIISLLITPAYARNWRNFNKPNPQQQVPQPEQVAAPAVKTLPEAPQKPIVKASNDEVTGFSLVKQPMVQTPQVAAKEVKAAPGSTSETTAPAAKAPTSPTPAEAKPPLAAVVAPAEAFTLSSQAAATQPPLIPGDDKFIIPPTEIGGAENPIPYGELVQLWVKPLAKRPENLHSVTYSWTVLPNKNVVVWPDTTRIIFGAGVKPNAYVVILTASYVYAVKTGQEVEVAQRTVTKVQTIIIGDGTGQQPPARPDSPTPGSTLTGVSKQAFEWTGFVGIGPDYPQESFKQDAAIIAKNFADVADSIGKQDPKLTSIIEILKATKTVNDTKVSNRNAWLPWFTKMSEFLQQLHSSGAFKTPKDCENVWREISAGLTAAAQ